MRGETMKGKSKKSTYSTTFGVDPRTKKDASLNQINSKLKRALAQSAGKYNYKAD